MNSSVLHNWFSSMKCLYAQIHLELLCTLLGGENLLGAKGHVRRSKKYSGVYTCV